ncbi:shikimate kinase [Lactobacillus sp. CBA3606]|uniref:shikimate kinase n=1 Tax=Lactobacillus sp. CBA3606 TaxID=2099789 RepID=UPI000CFE0A12|nr:shikimate kinase [Lactobacillus sp. CBA3606]AVK62792.1 shikimate kinase [Lactobacillus sp. CBA3606]
MQAILIGFMGSGKTTVGRLLAQQLQTQAVDLDDLIVTQVGQPITQIFSEQGETGFRHLEQATLCQALTQPGVLSTGGGTPTSQKNAEILMASSIPVIWLAAADQTILQRLANNRDRPLVNTLASADLLALKHRRASIYEGTADLIVSTDALTPLAIATQIVTWLMRRTMPVELSR